MQDTFINLDLHINCYYEDSECCRVVIGRFGLLEGFDISLETAALIRAEIANFEESHDGYDEDPTATVYFLHPNQLGKYLNSDETQQMKTAVVRMWHEANPDAGALFSKRNRGSMNVMNRIATKRRRKGGRFF